MTQDKEQRDLSNKGPMKAPMEDDQTPAVDSSGRSTGDAPGQQKKVEDAPQKNTVEGGPNQGTESR